MITPFTDGLSGKLADRAATLILTPAPVFWAGGVVAFVAGGGEPDIDGFGRVSPVAQIGVITLFLLLITASAAIVNRLAHPFLRVLEGYRLWPGWLRRWARDRKVLSGNELEASWQELGVRDLKDLSAEDRLDYVTLDDRLRRFPSRPGDYLPTRLGNVLRAAELRVQDKYGLDTAIVWPRLWLLLPEMAQKEISAARRSLDASVCGVVWGLLFLLWTPLHWFVVPVGIVVAVAGLVGARMTAATFADLVESAFDVYRTSLYEALRHPLPTTSDGERALGSAITIELLRGRSG